MYTYNTQSATYMYMYLISAQYSVHVHVTNSAIYLINADMLPDIAVVNIRVMQSQNGP